MERLYEAIVDLISNTSLEKIDQLADKIGKQTEFSEDSVSGWSKTPAGAVRLKRLLECWKTSSLSSVEFGGMIKGAAHTHALTRSMQQIDLVWTGPSTPLVSTRKTEQALLQVIQSAETKLFMSSFVAYDVASVIAALKDAMARGVSLSMLLESSTSHGGGISFDVIGKMRSILPEAAIFYWAEKDEKFLGGKVHAKVAVADEKICFISSANLTAHAMEKNMEAGLLIRGGTLPVMMHNHLEALVITKVLERT